MPKRQLGVLVRPSMFIFMGLCWNVSRCRERLMVNVLICLVEFRRRLGSGRHFNRYLFVVVNGHRWCVGGVACMLSMPSDLEANIRFLRQSVLLPSSGNLGDFDSPSILV